MKEEKKKISFKDYKVIWKYLKEDKFKVFLYIFLVFICVIPDAISPIV